MAGRSAKQIEGWDSGNTGSMYMGRVDLVVFKVILESSSALTCYQGASIQNYFSLRDDCVISGSCDPARLTLSESNIPVLFYQASYIYQLPKYIFPWFSEAVTCNSPKFLSMPS